MRVLLLFIVALLPQPAITTTKRIKRVKGKIAGLVIQPSTTFCFSPETHSERPTPADAFRVRGSLYLDGLMLLRVNHGIQETSARLPRLSHSQQDLEQKQPPFEVHSDEKVFLGVFAAVLP